jgi:antitoxin ParD1/3/4
VIRIGFNPIDSDLENALRTTQQLSITLPKEMAEMVKTKIKTGEYATESEVIRDGLRALQARDRAVDHWLAQQVGPAYDALMKHPDRALSAEQVRAQLAAEHAKKR